MKTALITTTINVPTVLALYRKYGPDVRFFVAVDLKTPNLAHDVFRGIENCEVVPVGTAWKADALIGNNCIQRRNIALLEALKWGAEVIVSIDDDNIPPNENYFKDFQKVFDWPHSGFLASSPTGWFDVGQLLNPVSPHRGFPYNKAAAPHFSSVVEARVGVAAGICLGDPDISAVTRIANGPTVHSVSELLHSGVVTDPRKTWTVYNTQNVSFLRELAPAMFCPPSLGRFDDIVASLVTQKIMRERGLHIHFGKPFIFQQRNEHNLVNDLAAELWGMLNIKNVAERLDNISLTQTDSAVEQVRRIYRVFLEFASWFPNQAAEAALAFCDDCEGVL